MLKKIMTLALAVLGLAAVAAPMASAKWTDKTSGPLLAGTNPQFQLTGQFQFAGTIGSIDCQTKTSVQLTGGQTTGHVNTFEIDLAQPGSTATQKCVLGTPLAACKVKSFQATQLPWLIHSDGADKITITTGQIHIVLENTTGTGECTFLKEITLEPAAAPHEIPNWNIPPGQTTAITQVDLKGKLTTSTGVPMQIAGKQTIQTPNDNTYGTA